MKLVLCSDFSGVGYRYLNRFNKPSDGQICLFVGYACEEDSEMYESSAKERLSDFGYEIKDLVQNFDFNQKIDAVFVRGGNTTKLIVYLKKYNQYESLKSLVEEKNILYIGNSAGSVLAGSDTEWTLEAEPYKDIKKDYGKDALKGFGWINKYIFVHASKYRMCYSSEMENPNDIFRTLDLECYPDYLKDIKKYKKQDYIKIANNEVYYENGKIKKFIKYDWRNIKLKIK